MEINLKEIQSYLKKKRLVLFTVTKDTVNFLKLYQKYQPDFTVAGIADPTLEYRPQVKALLDKARGQIPLYLSLTEWEKTFASTDLIIKFDHAILEDRLLEEMEPFSMRKFSLKEFEEKLRKRYEKYIAVEKGSEFTFIYPPRYQSFLNTWLAFSFPGHLTHCYGDDLLISFDQSSSAAQEEQTQRVKGKAVKFSWNALDFADNDPSINIYKLMRKEAVNQKPIFVVSSDFAAGKMSYLLQSGADFLSGDLFTAFFDLGLYYGAGTPGGASIASHIHKALARREHFNGHETPVYIKIEGDLDSWIFPFVQGCAYSASWGNFHRYFADYEFHIVIKEKEDLERLKDRLTLFCEVHHADPKKVKLVRSVNYCERFEEVEL